MMSRVVSNIFGVAWGKFIQTGTFDSHARFKTRLCHTGSTNTNSLWFVDDQSQTSIQHNYPCDFMNMKENILFLRNEWTTICEVDKTERIDLGNVFTYMTKHKETMKHKRFRQQQKFFVRCKKIDNNKRRRKQRRRQTRRSWSKKN